MPNLPADFAGLTIWRRTDGSFQASVDLHGTGWRCATGATPAEALTALFEPVRVALPPLPY